MSEAGGILVVVGMTREAKIHGGETVVIGGGDATTLAASLEAALRGGVAGVVSFGLCGALDPSLKVGDVVVGEAVGEAGDWFETCSDWTSRIVAAAPDSVLGGFARNDQVVSSVAEKAELRRRTGAAAVDRESYVVARLARWFGVPFAVVRAVSDGAGRALPHAAQVGLGPDGRPAVGAVMASLRANPWQLGALIKTALEAEDGFQALERTRAALGPRMGGPG